MSKAVAVSDTVYEKLERAAQSRGVSVDQLLDEMARSLPQATQTTVLDALSRGGLAPMSADVLSDLIDPTADYNAIRRALAQKPFTLSDTILSERG